MVIAAVEAVCTDEFNMHGVLATTMSVAPILVVNGPVAARIGMNRGINALGQGNRANSTIGRALQLVVRNVGGGRPGGVDRATLGSPAKVGFCFAEDETDPSWPSLAQARGFGADQSAVTAFCGEAPRPVRRRAVAHPRVAGAAPGPGSAGLGVAPGGAAHGRDGGAVARAHGPLRRGGLEPGPPHGRTRPGVADRRR